MSVNIFDNGCEVELRWGLSRDTTLGYAGPMSSLFDMPSMALCRRSLRKSNNKASRGHVRMFRTGAEHANIWFP